ncbi:unnamed protein product [Toxocara canis]|uniref:DUF4819 domain-containing protein n=1 Tax=Toxocara canis TaxID=6265 RepID=A0A183UJA0_TOXCA|nr:unnamed protein product [Toxocara canis]
MVGFLFGTSCVPVLRFIEQPPRTFTPCCPLSFSISLSIRQPVVVRISLLTDDLRPHVCHSISPQQPLRFVHSTIYKYTVVISGIFISEGNEADVLPRGPDCSLMLQKFDYRDIKTLTLFEGLYIKEVSEERVQQVNSEVSFDERSTTSEKLQNGFQTDDAGSNKSKTAIRIMVEACTSSASANLVSDSILADDGVLSPIRHRNSVSEPIVVVEISQQTVRKAGETVWVLLNKEPTEFNVVLSDGDCVQPVECVKLYGKLVIFTVPPLKASSNDTQPSVVNTGIVDEGMPSCDADSAQGSAKVEGNAREEVAKDSKEQCVDSAQAEQPQDSKEPCVDSTQAEEPLTDTDAQPLTLAAPLCQSTKPCDNAESASVAVTETSLKIIIQCGKQQIVLPLTFQCDSSLREETLPQERAEQVSSLFSFASGGDPLALLSPLVPLLSEVDSDGCK